MTNPNPTPDPDSTIDFEPPDSPSPFPGDDTGPNVAGAPEPPDDFIVTFRYDGAPFDFAAKVGGPALPSARPTGVVLSPTTIGFEGPPDALREAADAVLAEFPRENQGSPFALDPWTIALIINVVSGLLLKCGGRTPAQLKATTEAASGNGMFARFNRLRLRRSVRRLIAKAAERPDRRSSSGLYGASETYWAWAYQPETMTDTITAALISAGTKASEHNIGRVVKAAGDARGAMGQGEGR